jgi:26S proteasome regulatory subunit N8
MTRSGCEQFIENLAVCIGQLYLPKMKALMVLKTVTVSPLVLLSVVDHYKRLSSPRVIGVLLGSLNGDIASITNSFAIPFEESPNGFFFDTSYLKNMFDLYCRVNAQEQILGWYHSGPTLCKQDISISRAFLQYCSSPLLAIVNIHTEIHDIPCKVLQLGCSDELHYINTEIVADEAEEVGVEYLLRDIKERTGHTIKDKISSIVSSLKMYERSIEKIVSYLEDVLEKRVSRNTKMLEFVQEIVFDIPSQVEEADMSRIYFGEIINSFIAMNDLERNRIDNE